MSEIGPNFFIVGAAKSGTSALAYLLGQNSDIFMSPVKEPYYFCNKPEVSKNEYFSLFQGSERFIARGEATTGYLYDPSSPQKIKDFCVNAKIIVILRNPVAMAYSLWRYMVLNGNEKLSFLDALDAEAERERNIDHLHLAGRPENYLYIQRASYYNQILRYYRVFGENQVLVLGFEEFTRNPNAVIRSTYRFLGVRDDFIPTMSRVNDGGVARSRYLQWVTTQEYKILKMTVPLRWRRSIRSALKGLNFNPLPRQKPPCLPEWVSLRLQGDIKAMSGLKNVDGVLANWISDEV